MGMNSDERSWEHAYAVVMWVCLYGLAWSH